MPVIDQATRFRNELARHETSATNQVIDAYRLITNRLEDKLTLLMSRIEVLDSQNNLNANTIRKQAVWSSLLNQLEDEITKFGGYVDTSNTLAAKRALDLAGKHSQLLTAVHFENNPSLTQAFNATWDRLPTEAIETLLGFLQNDSELRSGLQNSLGYSATQNFQNKLLEGIALGYNPNKINALINQSLGEPLTWSLNTVRTTQLYAYREATRANYIANSGIIGGWKWYAALDNRTCLSCVNKHGREFRSDQSLNDHHQGRCTSIPLIKDYQKFGLEPLNIETGENWFNRLPTNQKIERMGYARYRAFLAGEFNFDELSEPYQNDIWGEMIKEASLVGMLGQRAERYYR